MKAPFAAPIAALASEFGTDLESGLSTAEAGARLSIEGPNELSEIPPPPWWRSLLTQFNQLVIWILVAATIVSGFLGDWLEAGAIFAIVLLNGLLGFFQERKAEAALRSLRKLASPQARVWRDGSPRHLEATQLVCGDLVELEAGDRVPADVRLLTTFGFKTQEAMLTGESNSVEKKADTVLAENAALADRSNMVFMGTTVVTGKARGVVAATGMRSELGRIASFLQVDERELTPLQKRLEEIGRVLIFACLALVTLIFVLQLVRGETLARTFLLAVSLAVAAVPEGLPAVVTIALALGLLRMVKRHALIRRLASVETLGAVTVICSDKTGTLTRNEMMVTEIVAGSKHYQVTGDGYVPEGEFVSASEAESEAPAGAQLTLALTIGLWCNSAQLQPPNEKEKRWQIIGDPTEGALIVAATKAGLARDPKATLVHEIPFDSERKMMSVVVAHPSQRNAIYCKGAPEILLAQCTFESAREGPIQLTENRRTAILEQSRSMAARALRVLGLAWRAAEPEEVLPNERDLVFAGLVGMIDPARDEARIAVAKCKSAGIRPVMITGDHPATALAIARALGIAVPNDELISGAELEHMSEEELCRSVSRIAVYARVLPEHKLQVVKALRAQGEVVAMTGDGVNDAPAVKMADIGIAMGITGTDVTKEASDMVLTDDNFASIVNAVEEGRGIYDNIQAFVHYLLASNASEILLVLFAAVVNWPVPLIPIQLLWINLITDGLPALALAMEKPAADVMGRQPRRPNEPFFTRERGWRIAVHGLLMAAAMITGFAWGYRQVGVTYAQAMAFYVTTFAQLCFSFACRSQRYTLAQLGVFSNPWLSGAVLVSGALQIALIGLPWTRKVFFGSELSFGEDWLVIFLLALAPVTIVELRKVIRSWFQKRVS